MCAPGLLLEFPPLASGITHPNNLPVQLTSFIGREKEIQVVCRLLERYRLITLTGSGGTGKTRLSLQVAFNVLVNYPNGAWLVELAPLADPDLIPKSVSSALNLPEISGKPVLELLVDFLRAKRLLLILDNCEHLLEACASLADKLLHACPELTILASSREFLGMEGEAPYRVPPMSLPDARHPPSIAALSEYDAVNLFVERARVVSPGFTITENNVNDMAQVVNRLDGIPLAIELAASRLRLLGIEQIAQRLNDAFRLLTGGSRTALPHHQTLRASIDWSYNLLSEPERILLRRLSVFAGSWRLQAAELVCVEQICPDGSDQSINPEDILDLLSELVDKSLVIAVPESEGRMRYRMLETIRQYAHEKLVDEKEAGLVRTRHLDFYLKLAEELEPKLRSREQIEALERLDHETDNLRLAFEWAMQTDVETGLRLASALRWFWNIRYSWMEGLRWLERGLEAENLLHSGGRLEDHQLIIRANALTALGSYGSTEVFSMREQAKIRLKEALAIYQDNDPEHRPEIRLGIAWAQVRLAWCSFFEGLQNQAQAIAQEAKSSFLELGNLHGMAECLILLGRIEFDPGYRKKLSLEALAIYDGIGDVYGKATSLQEIGFASMENSEYESACITFTQSIEYFQQVNDRLSVAFNLMVLGFLWQFIGNLRQVEFYLKQSHSFFSELGDFWSLSFCLFLTNLLSIAEGRFNHAAALIAAAWLAEQKTGAKTPSVEILYSQARLARLQGDLVAARKHAEEINLIPNKPGRHAMYGLLEMGYLAIQDGDFAQTRTLWREGLQCLIRERHRGWICKPLYALAFLLMREGKVESAARLFGTRWCRGYFHFLSPVERNQHHADLDSLRAALGDEHFERLYAEGKTLSLQRAINLALEVGYA